MGVCDALILALFQQGKPACRCLRTFKAKDIGDECMATLSHKRLCQPPDTEQQSRLACVRVWGREGGMRGSNKRGGAHTG